MRDTGHITLWNVECIFVEESDGISIIPKEKDKIKASGHIFTIRILFSTIVGILVISVPHSSSEYGLNCTMSLNCFQNT